MKRKNENNYEGKDNSHFRQNVQNENVSCRVDEVGDYRDEKTRCGIIKKIKKKFKKTSWKTAMQRLNGEKCLKMN